MTKTSSSTLRQWLQSDQPRERLLTNNAKHLSVAELLAVCLGTGCAGQDALSMARGLLAEFGSLDALLQAPLEVLLATRGLGRARVAQLRALHELTLRHSEATMRAESAGQMMSDVATVSRYLQRKLGAARQEIFACMYLDTRHRLLVFEEAFHGSVNRAYVFPREILRRSMELNAGAVVLAHNHPSGVAEPSHADLLLTRDLCELLAKVDVRVIDHVVVAATQTVSMASRGLIPAC